jgi:hypothetical protein
MGKPGVPEQAAPGAGFIGQAVPFAHDREQRRREVREDFFAQGQGPGVAMVRQVAGEQHQVRGGG